MIFWNLIYTDLAQHLSEYYKLHPKNTGQKLYKQLTQNSIKDSKNKVWFERFMKVGSIDPIHIFASFNASRQLDNSRIDRIIYLFKVLNKRPKYYLEYINFDGCPKPIVVQMQNRRSVKHHQEVWDLFYKVVSSQAYYPLILKKHNYKSWYGIALPSLSIFLFWVKPEFYLPLDKNTQFLLEGVDTKVPKDFESYNNLNINFRALGNKNLNLEIALESYYRNNDIKSQNNLSDAFRTLFDGLKEDYIPDFKLIALKVNQSENEEKNNNYLKILKPDYYYFMQNCKINNRTKSIEIDENETINNLYDVKINDKILKLNISAVVGKNGSGKSTLMELLYRFINNIAFPFRNELTANKLEFEEDLNLELFYKFRNKIYGLKAPKNKTSVPTYTTYTLQDNSTKYLKESNGSFNDYKDLQKFFYTISINYSLYGLNSKPNNTWVKQLFHKNDGYQTPIVLNPMRTNGKIDINRENDLVKTRLLALIFNTNTDNGYTELAEDKSVETINFNYIEDKYDYAVKLELNSTEVKIEMTDILKQEREILKAVKKHYKVRARSLNRENVYIKDTKNYIIRKIFKIAGKYGEYGHYLIKKEAKYVLENINEYIYELSINTSHISFKLNQAINYIKYFNIFPKINTANQFTLKPSFYATVAQSNEKYAFLYKQNIINYFPPPIFDVSINLTGNTSFENLSSGQKQQIHAASSLLYHIKNIDSVATEDITSKKVEYEAINIILDEIELYYHPEMQRNYISFLLKRIKELTIEHIKAINIIMVTHSPYILSDLTKQNVLMLKKGNAKTTTFNTFGSNIHDMLKNSFFMDDGFMGKFAQEKINELILFLNYNQLLNEKKIKEKEQEEAKSKIKEKQTESERIRNQETLKHLKFEFETILKEEIDLISKIVIYFNQGNEKLKNDTLKPLNLFNGKTFYDKVIEQIGEPILRIKLREMYDITFEDISTSEEMEFKKQAEKLGYKIEKK